MSGQKSGILGKFRNMVFETDHTEPQHEVPPVGIGASVQVRGNFAAGTPPAEVPSTDADPKIMEVLQGDVQAAARPALSEFQTMLDAMAAVIPDLSTRMKAVLAAMKGKGVGTEEILTDIAECLKVLDDKEKEDQEASASALQRRVGTKEERLAQIQQRRAQISDEETALMNEHDRLTTEISNERINIEGTHRRFLATVAWLRRDFINRQHLIAGLVTNTVPAKEK